MSKKDEAMTVSPNGQQTDVMPSGFTLKQENAIWSIIQYLAKEQFKNPRRVYKRKDVFDLIKAEMDW